MAFRFWRIWRTLSLPTPSKAPTKPLVSFIHSSYTNYTEDREEPYRSHTAGQRLPTSLPTTHDLSENQPLNHSKNLLCVLCETFVSSVLLPIASAIHPRHLRETHPSCSPCSPKRAREPTKKGATGSLHFFSLLSPLPS